MESQTMVGRITRRRRKHMCPEVGAKEICKGPHEGMPQGSLNAMEERQEAQASQDQAAAVAKIC